MLRKLGLLVRGTGRFTQSRFSATRKLYTDHIYPYDHKYVEKEFPSYFHYRETWHYDPWHERYERNTYRGFVLFWTWWWWMLLNNPHAVLGHEEHPDPHEWSDEELGIPPDDAGLYQDWLEAKLEASQ